MLKDTIVCTFLFVSEYSLSLSGILVTNSRKLTLFHAHSNCTVTKVTNVGDSIPDSLRSLSDREETGNTSKVQSQAFYWIVRTTIESGPSPK